MKVTKATKIYRPMRKYGQLLKDLFQPKSIHFWVRVKEIAFDKKEKQDYINAVVELLNKKIKINE
jgi:hypothetical protein